MNLKISIMKFLRLTLNLDKILFLIMSNKGDRPKSKNLTKSDRRYPATDIRDIP